MKKNFFSYKKLFFNLAWCLLFFHCVCSYAEAFRIYIEKIDFAGGLKKTTNLSVECHAGTFIDAIKIQTKVRCEEIHLATSTDLNNAKADINKKLNAKIRNSENSNNKKILDAKIELTKQVSTLPAEILASEEFKNFVEGIVKARMEQEREKIKQELLNELIQLK